MHSMFVQIRDGKNTHLNRVPAGSACNGDGDEEDLVPTRTGGCPRLANGGGGGGWGPRPMETREVPA